MMEDDEKTLKRRCLPWATISLCGIILGTGAYLAIVPLETAGRVLAEFGTTPLRFTHPIRSIELGLTAGAAIDLIISPFMNTSWLQLWLTLWSLWIVGRPVERLAGSGWMLLVFLLGALIGELTHIVLHPQAITPMVGASAGIAALLGALGPMSRMAPVTVISPSPAVPISFQLPFLSFTIAWCIVQVVTGMVPLLSFGLADHSGPGAILAGLGAGAVLGGAISLVGTDGIDRCEKHCSNS